MKQGEEKSKELTISNTFQPTPAMQVWLDKSLELQTDNISEIERESKITAQSWYGWLKQPEFIQWYRSEWDKRISAYVPVLDAIGMKFAKRGDVKFWEGMMKRTKAISDSPNVAVQVNNFIKSEKDKYGI